MCLLYSPLKNIVFNSKMQNESNLPAKYKAIERFAYNFLKTTPIGIISR